MGKRRVFWLLGGLAAIVLLLLGGYGLLTRGRPAPIPVKQKLYEGITYYRQIHLLPHASIVHIVKVDTQTKGLRLLVTPPDFKDDPPLQARTTSQFLQEFDLQVAINGDGFYPWWSRGPLDYYPHVGDRVTPNGFSASGGNIYTQGLPDTNGQKPTLYISRRNDLSFNSRPSRVFHAISGDQMLVEKGEIVPNLDNSALEPRTAIGINRNGRWLFLVVVDGRQPLYSQGVTFQELAQILRDNGAYFAMALDGGGSSTLVIQDPKSGQPLVLNSPIDQYVPGRERAVANHLGISVEK